MRYFLITLSTGVNKQQVQTTISLETQSFPNMGELYNAARSDLLRNEPTAKITALPFIVFLYEFSKDEYKKWNDNASDIISDFITANY